MGLQLSVQVFIDCHGNRGETERLKSFGLCDGDCLLSVRDCYSVIVEIVTVLRKRCFVFLYYLGR